MAKESTLTVSVEDAAAALGIGRSLAYRLARANELPVPVLRVGKRLLVPRAALTRLLGVNVDGLSGAPTLEESYG